MHESRCSLTTRQDLGPLPTSVVSPRLEKRTFVCPEWSRKQRGGHGLARRRNAYPARHGSATSPDVVRGVGVESVSAGSAHHSFFRLSSVVEHLAVNQGCRWFDPTSRSQDGLCFDVWTQAVPHHKGRRGDHPGRLSGVVEMRGSTPFPSLVP